MEGLHSVSLGHVAAALNVTALETLGCKRFSSRKDGANTSDSEYIHEDPPTGWQDFTYKDLLIVNVPRRPSQFLFLQTLLSFPSAQDLAGHQ